MTLTKVHIVDVVAEQVGYTKNQSSEMIEILLELIKRSLESGEDVLVSGFGKFCVKKSMNAGGRNPSTGDDMMLGPRKGCDFQVFRGG